MKPLALFVALVLCVGSAIAQDSSAEVQSIPNASHWTMGPAIFFESTRLIYGQVPSYVPSIRGQIFKSPDLFADNMSLGWSFEYHIGKSPKRARSSILLCLNYTGVLAEGFDTHTVQVWAHNMIDTVFSRSAFNYQTSWNAVHFVALYKFYVGNTDIGILTGPSYGYVFNHRANDNATLAESALWFRAGENMQLPTNASGNEVTLFNSKIPTSKVLDVGIQGGIDYRIELQNIVMYPGIFYHVNVGRLDDASLYTSWRFCVRASL